MGAGWDEAVAALNGATISAVDWGEGAPDEGDLLILYLEGGGAIHIASKGIRDVRQPFERGSALPITDDET